MQYHKMGRSSWDGEEQLGWGGAVGMGRSSWDGEEQLGWRGAVGMGRSSWDGEEQLGWGGAVGMGRSSWDGEEQLGWGAVEVYMHASKLLEVVRVMVYCPEGVGSMVYAVTENLMHPKNKKIQICDMSIKYQLWLPIAIRTNLH